MKELKYLNKYFYKYRIKLFLGFVITVIARIFSLFAPRLIGNSLTVVENYLESNNVDFEVVKNILLTNIFIIIGTALASGFFTFLMRQTIINVSRKRPKRVRNSSAPCRRGLTQRPANR